MSVLSSGTERRPLQRNRELVGLAALPVHHDPDHAGLAIDPQHHVLDKAGQQPLAIARGHAVRMPKDVHALSQRLQARRIGRRRLRLPGMVQRPSGLLQRAQRHLPVPLQRVGDQAVVGIDLAVASLGKPGLVPAPFHLQLQASQPGIVALRRLPGRQPRRFHACRRNRVEKRLFHHRVDAGAAHVHAGLPGAVHRTRAQVAPAPGVARVQMAPAMAARRERLQQGRPLPRLAGHRVRRQALLDLEPGLP